MTIFKTCQRLSGLETFMLNSRLPVLSLQYPHFFKLSVLSFAVSSFFVIPGCASGAPLLKPNVSSTVKDSNSEFLDSNSLDALQDLLSATDMRAVEGDRLQILKHGDVWKRMTVGFKMDLNHADPRIEAQRSWFISRQPYLDRLSARASRYLYHTVKEAERRGMPTELALLPVIESSYDPAATSSAAAAGLWQFIPSTGRIYGLKQNELYDGRRDVVESTRAAYEFLGALYNQFGSWELALASYNAGPGTVQKAINRNIAAGLPTDYWSLRLPQETMNYVPRFLAVAQIIKNPNNFGVNLPAIANRPHFREVMVSGGLDLNQIAQITGLPRSELYALNPAHRGERLAFDSQQRLLIPADLNPMVDAKLKALQPSSALLALNSSPVAATNKPVISASVPQTKTIPPLLANNQSSNARNANNANMNSAQVLQPSRSAPPSLQTSASATQSKSVTNTSSKRMPTPRGSDALAAFAASAELPSAPRIPVAITPAANVKPVNVQPVISAAEQRQILAQFQSGNSSPAQVATQATQQATQADKDQVVAEIRAIAPSDTEIINAQDGKIKLTALQTSLSVSEKKGQELTKTFAYPKALAEAETKANTELAQRNQGKTLVKTATDVVVIPPKSKRTTYTVVAGDTLLSIGMKNAVNWRDIAKWNQIDPEKSLYVGSKLYLYDAKPTASSAASAKTPEFYVVKAGDNLSGIADQFQLDVADLAEWNALENSSRVFVGQKLQLKASKGSASKKIESYTVQRGDTLQLLAQRFDLSLNELANLTEGLSRNSRLQFGQKINVPITAKNKQRSDKKGASENYTVKRGETLSSIADKFKLGLSDLRELNDLKGDSLDVGQRLKIPADAFKPDEYVVKSGDTLTEIAQRFELDLTEFARNNNLRASSSLQVGQRLQLDGAAASRDRSENSTQNSRESEQRSSARSNAKTESYTVKSGESWGAIAQRYDLTAKALAQLNNSSTRDSLQRGQSIQVPKTVTEYRIKRGDTLIGLANKYGIEQAELAQMNNLKPNSLLQVGDIIKVPN